MSRVSRMRKVHLFTLLCFAVAMAELTLVNMAAAQRFRRGDVNVDSSMDIADPIATLFHFFLGAEVACLDAADTNDDGLVDLADVTRALEFLFLEGPMLPPPGVGGCPGTDPTPDGLSCVAGEPEPLFRPLVSFWLELAPRALSTERQGVRPPTIDGVYQLGEGVSFVLVVEARSNFNSFAEVSLVSPGDPNRGDPAALYVTCSKDLGDISTGGFAAGENLAPFFLEEIGLWKDPFLLTEVAALRIDGSSSSAPDPGTYRFMASVTDADCASSQAVELTLEVVASTGPEVHLWLEENGQPSRANPATGGLLLDLTDPVSLVVEARPNGKSIAGEEAFQIDPQSLTVSAAPAVVADSASGVNIADRFNFDTEDVDGTWRWSLRLDPATDGFPMTGNSRIDVLLTSLGGDAGRTARELEVEISYGTDVQPIWNQNCSGCHERPQPNKGLELVNLAEPPSSLRANIVNVFASEPAFDSVAPLLVWPHHPERSYLFHKLRGTQNAPLVLGSGDRMPLDGPPFLSDDNLHLIESWIAQGAK